MSGSTGALRVGRPRWWKRGPFNLVLLMVIVALLAGVGWFAGRKKEAPPQESFFTELFPAPVALAPDLFLLGRSAPAAVYAVKTSAGLVLIDSGVEPGAASVLRQLGELHLDIKTLQAILLTHAHADHSAGADHLRSLTGATIYAGRADCPPLREGGPREALLSTFHMPDFVPRATRVDVELKGDETITIGETRFKVLAAPGHSPGSICYLLERPGLRALFAGDVIQSLSRSSNPLIRPLGTYAAYLPPRYRGSARDYLSTLRRLRALPVPDLILPGHPRMDAVPQSPRLSEKTWQDLLDQGIAEMERLLARYAADGAGYLDGAPKELLPGLLYLGDLDHYPIYCLNSPKGLFLFDAPGGPALLGFLAGSFKRLGWGAERKPAAVLLTSADEQASAGLNTLVADSGCAVVVSGAGVEVVRPKCPAGTRILNEENLQQSGWFTVKTIPLGGRGVAPLAYQIPWAGKCVLISGRIPVKQSDPSFERLHREVATSPDRVEQYLRSLDRLGQVKPDLWLTVVPVHGQNANLYDDEWARVLSQNARVVRSASSSLK